MQSVVSSVPRRGYNTGARADIGNRRVVVGGFSTLVATRRGLARRMVKDCLSARADRAQGRFVYPRLVFSSNGQGISLAGIDKEFARAMASADIIHADGMSVVLASRFLSRRALPERVATTDFFHDAAIAAQAAGLRFYLLGGEESLNAEAYSAVRRLYPHLALAGRHHGYFGEADDETICEEIRRCEPDVLWVGLGKPMQECWAVRNRGRLAGIGWIKTCGGLYGHLAGRTKRAPAGIQHSGLEWLWRACQEPRRLALRYLLSNPHAIYRMIRYSK